MNLMAVLQLSHLNIVIALFLKNMFLAVMLNI